MENVEKESAKASLFLLVLTGIVGANCAKIGEMSFRVKNCWSGRQHYPEETRKLAPGQASRLCRFNTMLLVRMHYHCGPLVESGLTNQENPDGDLATLLQVIPENPRRISFSFSRPNGQVSRFATLTVDAERELYPCLTDIPIVESIN